MKNITYTQFKKQLPGLIRDKGNLKYNVAVSADAKKRKKKIVVMDYDLYKAMDEYIEELECQVRLDRARDYNKRDPDSINFEELKKQYNL